MSELYPDESKKKRTVCVQDELWEPMMVYCGRHNQSLSEVIRQLLQEFMDTAYYRRPVVVEEAQGYMDMSNFSQHQPHGYKPEEKNGEGSEDE